MATDYTAEVVEDLGFGITAPGGIGSFAPDSMSWDCSIGGMKFLFATNEQNPMVRQTAQFRRERIDTERDPGEQSLENGLWIRSQASWHYGAGLSSAEPLEVNTEEAKFRYYQSGGIDPWTPGQIQLLNSTASVFLASAASGQQMIGIETGVLHALAASLTYIANSASATPITWGGSTSIFSLTDTGQVYLASNADGIWKGTLPTGSGTKIYNKYYTTPTYSLVRWVKSRLMYAENQGIWELTDLAPSSATLSAPFFANPNAGWRWTDFADGPAAIYASGYSRESSQIYKIGVTADETGVTLAVPIVVVDMPRGEDVLSMYSYVGSFLIVGTTKGVRVARIESDGSLTLGPLLWRDVAVDDAVGFNEYLYCTVRGKSSAGNRDDRAGLLRINLGQTLNNNPLHFDYSNDLVAPADFNGTAVGVTVAGDKLWIAVDGAGVVRETSNFISEGWIETGRIRYGTIEKKSWRDLRIVAPPTLRGTITAKANIIDTSAPSTWPTIITAQAGDTDNYGKLNSAAPINSSDLYVAFRLTTSDDCGCSARMTGYQIRAVPAPNRTEMVRVPVLLFDFETDKQGSKFGRFGGAYDRFRALKELENTGGTTQFIDYTTGERSEVYIEEVTFSRVTPPSLGRRSGAGGIATVLMRIV